MKCKEIKIGQLKFANPVFGASGCVGHEILAGLIQFCDDNGIDSFAELTGSVQI